MPTLQDVAKQAGVSTATVSKVLSNTPYVSEPTRARVLAAVDALGYRPNLAARALSSGKTFVIGVVFPYVYDAIFKDPLVMQILQGIEMVCTERGYNILLNTPRKDDDGLEHFMRMISSGYVEGLIAIDNVEGISFAEQARARDIPAVVLGYQDGPYSVRSDDFAGGQLAMQHALAAGHRHIGIIDVPQGLNLAIQRRIAGMRDVAQANGIDFDALPYAMGDFSASSGARAADALLEQAPDLTLIISSNDRMALGAMTQLRARGKRIPADVSVMGYDNIATAAVSNPPLTTINQRAVSLGQAAARAIFDVLADCTPSPVVLQPEVIERASLARIQ